MKQSAADEEPRTAHRFALIGTAGFVAPRHLRAIYACGGRVVAALDPRDAVGVLDRFDLDIPFFTEPERFDRHLEKLRLGAKHDAVTWMSVCSPNYLHDAHCRLGLRLRADVICEKPVVINPWNLDPLAELEAETGRRIWTVLQLRTHPALVALRDELMQSRGAMHDVVLTYVTARGHWYGTSWKGNAEKSGGIATNIGVHMFDMLSWLFGAPVDHSVHVHDDRRMAGVLRLERARVRWFLSVDARDLPSSHAKDRTFRAVEVDGSRFEFSDGFDDLHTRVYERTLAGHGFGLAEARPAIELSHSLRLHPLVGAGADAHPFVGAP